MGVEGQWGSSREDPMLQVEQWEGVGVVEIIVIIPWGWVGLASRTMGRSRHLIMEELWGQ